MEFCSIKKFIHFRPFKDKQPFVGTSRYASISAHKGFELGRKDDLESLLYVMIYCLKGYTVYMIIRVVTYHGKI